MRYVFSFIWALILLGIALFLFSYTGFGAPIHASLQAHLLDWVMGFFCLFWLMVLLKVPWDLYFQAHAVGFELQRARERGIKTPEGRVEYIQMLRPRLLALALGAHVFSSALIAGITYATHGQVGYYFAVFYLVSTVFRPVAAGYTYLAGKLLSIGTEAHYPREDVMEMRDRLQAQEEETKRLKELTEQQGEALQEETIRRESETRELRQGMQGIGREFEGAIGRLTDNQEVIKGIQAFVRLISQSTA